MSGTFYEERAYPYFDEDGNVIAYQDPLPLDDDATDPPTQPTTNQPEGRLPR